MRRGRRLLVKAAVLVAIVGVTAAATLVISGRDGRTTMELAGQAAEQPAGQVSPPAAGAQPAAADAAQGAPVEGAGTRAAAEGDLRKGAVFVQSNDEVANEVVAFARRADGRLTEVGRYPTGGVGSGSFEDSAQGIVLGTAEGEAAPIQNVDKAELLFVVNAGSGTISVFRVNPDGLELVNQTSTGGKRPVSLTVNNGLLYVLNSGESDRRLILGPTTALENCGHGDLPTVTGFRVTPDGALQPIADSTRTLSGRGRSGCSQVSFTPDGRTLVVTERIASLSGQGAGKGAIATFEVRYDGSLGRKRMHEPSGAGPFGFTFTRDGKLITSEQNGGLGNPGGGHAAAYEINGDRTLKQINGSVANRQTDSCWVVVTDDQRYAFVSSPFDDGIISTYRLAADGSLSLLHPVSSARDGKDSKNDDLPQGATDISLSRDTKFLYQLNSFEGSLYVFAVNGQNGLLSLVERLPVFQLEPFGKGGEAAPFGLAAF
ncbi:lactonase family protein [Nonomuraea candida]|uniref:lactonase family protein n=1 Tax=Nonomuraea candida TaxID=359159 RepID=UPI0005BBC911|nr:beta-propeller fold lactonase family protein [Nonomuraea candida]